MNQMTKVDLVEAASSTISATKLKALIEQGKPLALLDVVVTPELAKLMLTYNTAGETNRKLKRFYVNEQVEVVKNGRWINTGEPVIFSADAILNDGQHRLETVVAANLPIITDIRLGVARRAFVSTNTGHKRSGADALGLAGFVRSNLTAATCRMVWAYREGLPGALFRRIQNELVVEIAEAEPLIQDSSRLAGTLPKLLRTAAVSATIFMAMKTANASIVHEFAEVLRDGGGSTSNPPHRFREACLNSGMMTKNTSSRGAQFAYCLQAWNAYKAGTTIGRWWKPGEPFPKVDGFK